MKYFTTEEAKAVIAHGDVSLCAYWDKNPALEAAKVLHDTVCSDRYARESPFWAAVAGFILGRATGIREERQRRQGDHV